MSTTATCVGVLKVHSFTPRDRWNSLCVCGLSIAAHDDPPLWPESNVREQVDELMVTTPLGKAPGWIEELIGRDTIDTRGRIARIPVHRPNQEPTWPSLESPFSS